MMDRPLKKKHPLIRYKYPIAGILLMLFFFIYSIVYALGSKKLKISDQMLITGVVEEAPFLEYIDVEGVVKPILTIEVNTQEGGSIERIMREEGSMLEKGDTILLLSNPELKQLIEDQRDDYEKQVVAYREKEIEMEQKSLLLKQQMLQNDYELKKMIKKFEVDCEDFDMGIKSKAQLEIARDEYEFNIKKARLQKENLKHDSTVNILRKELLINDLKREYRKYERMYSRLDRLIVCAPIGGQLSFVSVTPGQQVTAGNSIGQIKVLDQFRIETSIGEYYIDRIVSGLSATIEYQNRSYSLKVSKVVPEIRDRAFSVSLVFTGDMPENVRIGKSYRVKIELGLPEKGLVIPRGNFYQETKGRWIFKLNETGEKAVRVPLIIGRQNPQQYEIIDGLKAGDKVVISGYENFGDVEELILKK